MLSYQRVYMCWWYVPITVPSNPLCFSMVGFCKVPNMSVAWTKQDYLVAHGKEERIGFVERILSGTIYFQFFPVKYGGFQHMFPLSSYCFFPVKIHISHQWGRIPKSHHFNYFQLSDLLQCDILWQYLKAIS